MEVGCGVHSHPAPDVVSGDAVTGEDPFLVFACVHVFCLETKGQAIDRKEGKEIPLFSPREKEDERRRRRSAGQEDVTGSQILFNKMSFD